jgi:hypothetical protein
MKFKVGDKVKYKGDNELFKVVQIAEEGETVVRHWWDEYEKRETYIHETSYILENEKGRCHGITVRCEKYLELITKETSPKFKVGDIVEYKDRPGTYKVIKIAEEGETVKGPWMCGFPKAKVFEKGYILEDKDGWFYYHAVKHDERLYLVTEEELKNKLIDNIKDLEEELEDKEAKLKTLKDALIKGNYYEVLRKNSI